MVPTKDGRLRSLRVFQHIAVFLLLTHSCGAEYRDIGPSHLVMLGKDIVLPCHLEPPMNAVSMTLEWGRPDLDPRFVFLWHDGKELLAEQNRAYKGRASLSVSNMKHGNISLKLTSAKISDNGRYRCYIPKLNKEYFVDLLVGAVSSPAISLTGIDKTSSRVILNCESVGWYPEPEVLWLDGEGNLLSAEPTETVRGPDDLYTVSSRVTVEKRHSNSFTCRVQQQDTNHTREAHITVPEDFFMASSGCAASTTFSVLFGFMFVSALGFIVWKWRQQKTETRTQINKSQDEERRQDKETSGASNNTEQQSLMKGKVSKEQLMAENRKMKEEKEADRIQVIKMLQDLKNELERQKEKLMDQEEKTGKQAKENGQKVKSVEKEVTEMEGDITFNRGQGYLKLREIITKNNWILEERKQEIQKLHIDTDTLIQRTGNKINTITGDKEEKKDQTRKPHEANKETVVVTKTEKIDSEETEKKNETEQQ